VTVVKGAPKDVSGAVEYNNETFKHFQSAVATTWFALGEFPWQFAPVTTSRPTTMCRRPVMLSREATDDEVTWSLSTYTAPERIAESFKLANPLPGPRGVFANQPNPRAGVARAFRGAFGMLVLGLLGVMAARFAFARNEPVFTQTRQYSPTTGDTGAFVTRAFALPDIDRTSSCESKRICRTRRPTSTSHCSPRTEAPATILAVRCRTTPAGRRRVLA
jgi:hypothetical protein